MEIRVCQITAIRAPCERCDDLACARFFFGMTGRMTYKNATAARRVAWTGGVKRTSHGEHLKMRMARRISRIRRTANERLQASGICCGAALDESRGDYVRARFQWKSKVTAFVDLIP